MIRGRSWRRTLAAAALVTLAIAVPCAAWWITGNAQLEREAAYDEQALWSRAQGLAGALADRLGNRLETLRETEADRPVYHYQNLFHDPEGAAEGASISRSPLARGVTDPLVDTHFQVDQRGELSLPTLNDAFPELGQDEFEAGCDMMWKLRDVAVFCGAGLTPTEELASMSDASARVETMPARAWRQHLQANEVYGEIKGQPLARQIELEAEGEVALTIGGFIWHTLPVGGEPTLVALRPVTTPEGPWTQGFTIDREAIAELVDNPDYAATFQPERAAGARGLLLAPVDGTPWQVALDLGPSLAVLVERATERRKTFRRTVLLVGAAAAIAGLLVVLLVRQSEKLALQRVRFAASAAHELRTPLAGLRLYGEMLAEGMGDPTRSRDYARRMASEAERLARVVTNVLGFTRLERGELPVDPVPGDLAAAVLEAVARQRPALDQAGLAIQLDFDEDLPPVRFDRDAVGQIVQNLLDNAEKYSRGVDERTAVVSLRRVGEAAELRVRDNGPGVSPVLRRRLFQPFVRGDARDAPEGLGLGLVLVRQLARAQGGDIQYRDGLAGGAEFRVALPLAA